MNPAYFPNLYWRTQDGRYLHPSEMSTAHVVNLLNYLERRGITSQVLQEWYHRFQQELERRAPPTYAEKCKEREEVNNE